VSSAAKGWLNERESEAIVHCTQSGNAGPQSLIGTLRFVLERLDHLDGLNDAVSFRYERREPVDPFSN
jgi:hypothetical protein